MKKFLSFILSVFMIISVMSLSSFAAPGDACTVVQKNIASDAVISLGNDKGVPFTDEEQKNLGVGGRIDLGRIVDGKVDTGTFSPKMQKFSLFFTYPGENVFRKIVANVNGSGTATWSTSIPDDTYNITNVQFVFYDYDGNNVYETEVFDTIDLKELIVDNISVSASKVEIKITGLAGEASQSGLLYLWEVETYADVGDHVYVYHPESTVAPTCVDNGKRIYTCECGFVKEESIPASGIHEWDEGAVTTQPDETTPGVKTFTCTVCKTTITEEIPATSGHNWDKGVSVDPTCTDRGYTLYTCTDADCDETYKDKFVNAMGHDLDIGTVIKHASLTEQGQIKYSCQRSGCDYSYVDDKPVAKYSDSTFVLGKENVKSVTATSNYSGVYYSGSAPENIIDSDVGTLWSSAEGGGSVTIVLDHEYVAIGCKLYVWSNWNSFSIEFFDDSDNSVGKKGLTNVQIESPKDNPINLGELIALKNVKKIVITIPNGVKWQGAGIRIAEIELTAHKCLYDESEKTGVIPADCAEKINGFFHGTCYVCGEERDVVVPYSDAHQYKFVTIDVPATCIEDGKGTRVCEICDAEENNVRIPATGKHTFTVQNEDISPTCVDTGKGHYTCKVCSTKGSSYEIPATNDHSYDWKQMVAPTYTKDGLSEHVCTVCGTKEEGVTQSITKSDIEDDLFTFDKYSIRLTDFVGVRATFKFDGPAIDNLERQGYDVEIIAYVKNSEGVEKSVKIYGEDSENLCGDEGFSVVVKGGGYYDEYSFRMNVTITDEYGTATKDVYADELSADGGDCVSVCEIADFLVQNDISTLTEPVKNFYQSIVDKKPKK